MKGAPNRAMMDFKQVRDAMESIDQAQAVIATVLDAPDEPPPISEPVTEDPPPYVPAVDIPPSEVLVEVEFLRPVTVTVAGVHKAFGVGKTCITAGLCATIKQTHQADALVG